MAGVEVSSCRFLGEGLDSVVTARILEMRPHPNAERLSLCKVTDGSTGVRDRLRGEKHEGRGRGGAGEDRRAASQRRGDQKGEDPRPGVRGDALLGAGAEARRDVRGDHDPSGRHGSRQTACRRARAFRLAPRGRDHAEPGRLPERARRGPRDRLHHRGEGRSSRRLLPGRGGADRGMDPDRRLRPGSVPAVHRPGDLRRDHRPFPGLDAAAPHPLRDPPDQQHRRRHQLPSARGGTADARLRPRPVAGGPDRRAGPERNGDLHDAGRVGAEDRSRDAPHPGRGRSGGRRRRDGRGEQRGRRRDDARRLRERPLLASLDPKDGETAWAFERILVPLRAGSRPGREPSTPRTGRCRSCPGSPPCPSRGE